jgi:ankyrin repeat protein
MPPFDLPKQIRIDDEPDAYNLALKLAARDGRVDLVPLLLKVDGINPNFVDGSTPLILAAANGHIDVVQLLLKIEGIDVNLQDWSGGTAFYQAVCHYQYEVVELLLKRDDIDPNLPDNKGRTALYCVYKNMCKNMNHFKMVDLLLEHDKVDPYVRETFDLRQPLWQQLFPCGVASFSP